MGKISGYTLKLILGASFGSITYGYPSGLIGTISALPNQDG